MHKVATPPLLASDVLPVQTAYFKTSFELAPASKLAEAACTATNEALDIWGKDQGSKPGELLLEQGGQKLVITLLAQEVVPYLREGNSPRAVRREMEML